MLCELKDTNVSRLHKWQSCVGKAFTQEGRQIQLTHRPSTWLERVKVRERKRESEKEKKRRSTMPIIMQHLFSWACGKSCRVQFINYGRTRNLIRFNSFPPLHTDFIKNFNAHRRRVKQLAGVEWKSERETERVVHNS